MGTNKFLLSAGTLILMFLILYSLWFYYLAVMNLMRARNAGTLSPVVKWLGLPIFFVGYLLDVLVNIFILSFILMEMPREWTVTARLSRHINHSIEYRLLVSVWICHNLLDPFDPSGCHCHPEGEQ